MSCECDQTFVCQSCENTYELQAKTARVDNRVDDLLARVELLELEVKRLREEKEEAQ